MAKRRTSESTSRLRSDLKKNREIADLLEKHRPQIEAGELIVYIIDECHLLWNDLCGYLWNLIKSPQKIPIFNPKERQTYYGALELFTQEFILAPEPTANGELTVEFVKKLIAKHPNSRILLIWDGASYYRGQAMRDFLTKENEGVTPENWKITCIRFAPYAPQENPVEAINKFGISLKEVEIQRQLLPPGNARGGSLQITRFVVIAD